MYPNKPYLRENFSQEYQKSKFMLVRFIVSNFMSFKEETEFNMLPASGQKRLKEHIYSAGGIEVLKMGAIYGANGAGKSNLVKAIEVMKEIITERFLLGIDRFKLDKYSEHKPTNFEIEFICAGKVYDYGISVNSKMDTIIEEWLYETGAKDRLIFERKTDWGVTSIKLADEYLKTEEDKLRLKLYENDILHNDTCLLQIFASSKEPFEEMKRVYHYIQKKLIILDGHDTSRLLNVILFKNPNVFKFVNDNLKNLNSGIHKLDFESTDIHSYFGNEDRSEKNRVMSLLHTSDKGVIVNSETAYAPYAVLDKGEIKVITTIALHKGNDDSEVKFDLENESDGTQVLIEMLPWVYNIMNNSNTLIVDEIESHIHVNLLKELISKFSKDKNTKGQLIFTTHESNLLDQDILRQDEIWFAEKNPAGETGFYPLSDYEIRSDLDIRKGYLNGRFGAIPFLANLHDLNWDKYAKDEA